ncbi:hypothetical protein AAE478_003287 [Parahypoxylon ruwenzoriense]
MYASFITVASALVASVAAETYATWPATGFTESCSPGGCIGHFNINAPAGYVQGAPAFDVRCNPIYIQRGWLKCDPTGDETAGSEVNAMWVEASTREQIKISVAHIWYQGEARYNASGIQEFASGETTFDIPVTQLTAVL